MRQIIDYTIEVISDTGVTISRFQSTFFDHPSVGTEVSLPERMFDLGAQDYIYFIRDVNLGARLVIASP